MSWVQEICRPVWLKWCFTRMDCQPTFGFSGYTYNWCFTCAQTVVLFPIHTHFLILKTFWHFDPTSTWTSARLKNPQQLSKTAHPPLMCHPRAVIMLCSWNVRAQLCCHVQLNLNWFTAHWHSTIQQEVISCTLSVQPLSRNQMP